jgi:hypothetical protein
MSTWGAVIEARVGRNLRGMAKALPGVVISYDEETETCSVQPAVHELVPTEEDPDDHYVRPVTVIPNVQVAWPRGRNFRVVGKLNPGDSVLLLAFDRNANGWRRSGKASEPDVDQVHSWSSVVALPGLEPDVGGFPVPSDAAARASRVEAELESLREKLNDLVSAFNTHVHASIGAAPTVVAAPGVPPIPALPAPAVGSVASAAIKLSE